VISERSVRSVKRLLAMAMIASMVASMAPQPVFAQPGKPSGQTADAEGKTPLQKAAEAWELGLLPDAAKLYQQALDAGDLYPADVVIAYARMGTALAAQKKDSDALSAFRTASILDPAFKLPPEAGAKAKKLYDQAAKDAQARGGKLSMTTEVPESLEANAGFKVVAKLPEEYAILIDKVRIEVKDPLSKNVVHKESQPATGVVTFTVPGKAAVPGVQLQVRVDALDAHANRWVSQESRIKVARDPNADKAAAPMVSDEDEKPKPKKKSFFATP